MGIPRGERPRRAVTASEPEDTVASYTLLTKLATGGMATVYVGCRQGAANLEQLVAIKCCHPHLGRDEEFVSMFLDEANLATRLHHPNVVATLDVGSKDRLYLVMEYVEGDCLTALLRRAMREAAPMPIDVILRVMADVLAGLHSAHELRGSDGELLNVVHRDVSPQNILVGVNGVAKITDFGIAFAATRSTVTRDGMVKGKFAYMAPEQVKGEPASRRLDVFSAGIVLWELLTSRLLFRRQDDARTIDAVLTAVIPAPSSINPMVPPELDAVVLKALERDPAARYQTAAELADALGQLFMPPASGRAVGKFVEDALGPTLAERRDAIRRALAEPPQRLGAEFKDSEVRRKRTRATPPALPPAGFAPDEDATPTFPGHASDGSASAEATKRRHMLIAVAMLLLACGALGLLLARWSARAVTPPAAAPQTPAARP